jgi:NADH:ubiquinone oxidoreductase subunit E
MNGQASIKVCVSGKCGGKGSEKIAETLERDCIDCGSVERTGECFGYCALGPNVAVDGNILHHMNPRDAASRVKEEIRHPSPKVHGIGDKTLDDLDSVLDSL